MADSKLNIPDLAGKAVLITGASTGIGAALVRAFAAQGAMVGIHYNASAGPARSLAEEVAAGGGRTHLVQADVTKTESARRAVDAVATAFGRLDGLINNAGGMVARVTYEAMTDEYYDAVMDLNARSVLSVTAAAIPHLKRQGGFIINTVSVAGRTGASAGAGVYGSSKAFVSNVTRGMAKELIPFDIRVNAVSPGIIDTPFHERYTTAEQMAAMRATIPMGRIGTAEECQGTYLYLASKQLSGYIVGQTIEINGGQYMP